MVAEVGVGGGGGGYRASSSASSFRVGHAGSTIRPIGVYGSTSASYTSADNGSTAPVFGRIRITQSVERDSMSTESASSPYGSLRRLPPPTTKTPATVHGARRYSLSTDRVWSVGGSRSSLQSPSFYGSRRASLAAAGAAAATPTLRHSTATPATNYHHQRLHTADENGSYLNSISYSNGLDSTTSLAEYHHHHHYGSSSSVSGVSSRAGNVRAASVISGYDDLSGVGRERSISRHEVTRAGRSPSVPPRYGSQASLGRAPSVPPRYEAQNHFQRAPSVSRHEGGYTPSHPLSRASSVSQLDGVGQSSVGRRFRSASVSRYEVPSSLGAVDDHYQRARSVARSELHYESTVSTPVDSAAVDDDSAYELRRQLRALRNQQIRAGSVSRQEHQVEHHHVIRPRSMSTSSSTHRRHKVVTVHTPVQVHSPSNPPLITGYPEPTLYSARVFRTLPGSEEDRSGEVTGSSTELGFRDSRDDIESFVLKPGERFLPTDVSVALLPSGRKAVTYTQYSQKGSGDQQAANSEIERIIQKTKNLQDSMHTLEDFVKRNRSLFPEDIIIYQKIVFYLLSEAELVKMGERPDAEIYGVKIRERLVAPLGTDVASILKRFYSKHSEVDVEYEHPEIIRQQLKMTDEGKMVKIPNRGKRFDDDFSTDLASVDWTVPDHRPRSTDYDSLYIEEDNERRKREAARRSPKGQLPSAPEFTHRLRRQKAVAGQSVRFSCSVSSFPEAEVRWYRDKQEISENGRFTTKNISGLCTLTISEVTADDAALYTAKATNSAGEATTSALLEVHDYRVNLAERPGAATRKQPSSEPTGGVGSGAGTGAGRRPFFLLEARNLWADVGERAVFEVQAAGKPLPSFTWIRDDDQLSVDDHIDIVCDGYGNCKLVIREIRETDFGTYRCLAENEDGTVESIAALFCVGNESVRPGQALKDELRSTAGQHKGRRPQFVHLPPSRVDVNEGEALTLQCVVDGDPKPLVTWYKGVRELTYTGRHRVLEERNNCYVMQLKSTLATDSGEYTVTAHNLCGLVESIVCVNVLPGQPPTEDFDTKWKRPDITPLEYELVTKTRQGKMPPVFVKKLPREKQMKVGESLKFDCHIEESKPRQYLVDVDVVVKDNKAEELRLKDTEKLEGMVNGEERISPKPSADFQSEVSIALGPVASSASVVAAASPANRLDGAEKGIPGTASECRLEQRSAIEATESTEPVSSFEGESSAAGSDLKTRSLDSVHPEETTEEQISPDATEEQTIPVGTEEQTPPAATEERTLPAATEKQAPPVGTEEQTIPAAAEEQTHPAGTEEQTTSVATEEQTSPARTEEQTSPAGTEEQTPPAGTEEQTSPAGTEEQTSPAGTEEQTPPAGTEEQTSPAGTEEQTSPAGTEEQTPPGGAEIQSDDRKFEDLGSSTAKDLDSKTTEIPTVNVQSTAIAEEDTEDKNVEEVKEEAEDEDESSPESSLSSSESEEEP